MGRNIDRGLDKGVEKPQTKDSGSKTPKTDKVVRDTRKTLSDNFSKKRWQLLEYAPYILLNLLNIVY